MAIDYATKVCKRGHVGNYDKHRSCKACKRIDSLAYHNANRDAKLAKVRNKRKENPVAAHARDKAYYDANRNRIVGNAKRRRHKDPAQSLFEQAKSRAKRQGVPFTILKSHVIVPKFCPLLGTELKIGNGKVGPNSPTLDKIIPALGYVPGNVLVISHRANAIKNNATLDEMRSLVANWGRRAWEQTQTESGTEYAPAAPLAEQA